MKISDEARDHFYKEVGIHLAREGFSVQEQQNSLLPIEWNGAPLCRITAGGGAQFRREDRSDFSIEWFCMAHASGMRSGSLSKGQGFPFRPHYGIIPPFPGEVRREIPMLMVRPG